MATTESLLALALALNSSTNSSSSSIYTDVGGVTDDAADQQGTVRLSDVDLASRRAEEAASRRYQAAGWLRKMVGVVASRDLPNEPSEEEFRLGLRNGILLCNVINKVHPGSVPKVVESPAPALPSSDGAPLLAYQYFENVRNFLVAVQELNLPTFEASDLEKGGSSAKVVNCILALKSYSDWKQTGGNGFWKYGGNLKPPSVAKPPIKPGRNSDPFTQSILKNYQPPADSSTLLNNLGLNLPEGYLTRENLNQGQSLNSNGMDPSSQPLNRLILSILSDKKPEEVPTLVESMLAKVMEEFERRLAAQGEQLKKVVQDLVVNGDGKSFPKSKILAALTTASGEPKVDVSEDEGKEEIYGVRRAQHEDCFSNRSSDADEDEKTVPNLQTRFDLQQRGIGELKWMLHNTKEGVQSMQMEWNKQLYNLGKHMRGLAQAAAGYHKVLEENRQLYNQVQDLKGSIRVYCRVRPFLPGQSNGQSTVDYIGEDGQIMIANPAKQGKDIRKSFTFNKVFGASATQEEVFLDTRPLIRSVLDGYNVCIFAYGQTGSGKTYTMTGPKVITEESWGVNYRALNDLFQISKRRKDTFIYEVAVQMIEIYNEQVRDLLVSDSSNKRLEIRNNSQQKGLNVPDANLIPVASTSAVMELMNLGHKNRVVGATALNDRSSRSHSVLTVHVQGRDLTSGTILRGCLHLVDLAGSERVDKSEATGDRLKEAQHINRSLSALGDVIAALAQKSSHVPYRNSKLTQLLQDSLGGQAKTLMFVHISPELDAHGETISTLKFAERVATVELGAARSNKESGEVRELKEQIASLKNALAKKEAEVEQRMKIGISPITRDSRNSPERQRMRTGFSPMHLQMQNMGDVQSQVNHRQPMEDVVNNIDVRNNVTGRQKRPPTHAQDFQAESIDASPLVFGNGLGEMKKAVRRPSPDRRLTLDHCSQTKNKIKHDIFEEQDRRNWQDKVMMSKYLPIQGPSLQDDVMGSWEGHELEKLDNPSEIYNQMYHANQRKIHPDCEEEKLLRQQLHEMQGVIKSRPIRKDKREYDGQRTPYEAATTDESEVEIDARSKDDYLTSDSSEADLLWQFKAPNVAAVTPVEHVSASLIKKPPQRMSKTPERRSPSQAQGPLGAVKLERKPSNKFDRKLPSGGMEGKRSSSGGKLKNDSRVIPSK